MSKSLLSNKCIMTGDEVFGDRRYRYKAWRCMTEREREVVGRYPHHAKGIPDSAYAYPITRDGKPANARRALLWKYDHVKRRVAKARGR